MEVVYNTSVKQSVQIPSTFKPPKLPEANTAMTFTISFRLGLTITIIMESEHER